MGQHPEFRIVDPAQPGFDFGQSGATQIPPHSLEFRREGILRQAGLRPPLANLRSNEILCSCRHLLRFRSLTITDGVRMIAPNSEQYEALFASTR